MVTAVAQAMTMARGLHRGLPARLHGILTRNLGVILAKAAFHFLGLPAGPVRLPLPDATPMVRRSP